MREDKEEEEGWMDKKMKRSQDGHPKLRFTPSQKIAKKGSGSGFRARNLESGRIVVPD